METGISGLFAGIVAIPMGIALSVALIEVINLRSFGWSMEFAFDITLLLHALGLAVLAALAGGLWPAWRFAQGALPAELRNE